MTALIPAALLWVAVTLAVWRVLDWRFLWAWLVAGTVVTALAFAIDKGMSKLDGWRIPEVVLLGLSLYGGVLGGWAGMLGLRHKTLHRRFWVVQWVATALWVAIVAWFLA
jgi:uncharacterized membrane protein YsdA (DUF1294 family)